MTFFGGKSVKNGPNMALRHFLLSYRKSAENEMIFDIHVTTIAAGSLSFGLKNRFGFFGPLSFFGLEFFRKC